MVDHAVASFDRVASEAERKWGYDRLPELVSPDLAAKYGGAIAYLNEAIRENDPTKAAAAASNCIKGIQAIEAEAAAAGHRQPQCIANYELDGFAFRIVANASDTSTLPKDGIQAFTLREVAIALRAQLCSPLVAEVKSQFPRAEVISISQQPPVDWKAGGDPIPFRAGGRQ